MFKAFMVQCVCLGLIGCSDGFVRDNPFDPEAPEGTQAPATICGTILSDMKEPASPLAGAEVSIVELGLNAETDAQGFFTFANLASGSWTLLVEDGRPADSNERHLDARFSFTVAPGEEPECQSIVLTAIPETPTLLSLAGNAAVSTSGGSVMVRYASPPVDAGCLDVNFSSTKLGNNEVSKATIAIEETDLVGTANKVEVREFSVDIFDESSEEVGASVLYPTISALDTYDVTVRIRRTARECSEYKGAASNVSSSLRYAFHMEAQFTSTTETLQSIDSDEVTSKLHLTESGGLVSLFNSGKLTYSTSDGTYLGCLDLGQALGTSFSLQDSSNNFKRIRERDGFLYIMTEGVAFRLTRVDEAQLITELSSRIDASTCATSSSATETLWQRPKTPNDLVKGLLIGEESWGVVTVLGSEGRIFRGSLRDPSDESFADLEFQTDDGITPTSHELVSDPVVTGTGILCSLKAKNINESHYIAYYPSDGEPYYLTVPYQPGKLTSVSDDLFVAVVGSRSWDLSLSFIALNRSTGTLAEVATFRPREAVYQIEFVPTSTSGSGVLVMSGADRPAIVLSNLTYLTLAGTNSGDVSQVIIQVEERGDAGVYGFDTVANDFNVDVGILTDLTTRVVADDLQICSAFNRKNSHVCVGLTP